MFPSYLIKVDDDSQFNLLHAIELMRLYAEYLKKQCLSEKSFRLIKDNQALKLTPYVDALKLAINIKIEKWNIHQIIDAIQEYYDSTYPGDYGIFVFSKYTNDKKPIYKSNTDHYFYPLLIYLNDGQHYDGIKTLGAALRVRSYCLSCETSYDRRETHSNSCRSLCIYCRRMGPTFPCAPVINYYMKCPECNIIFKNPGCFNEHRQRKLCQKFQKCEDCNVIYYLKDNTRDGRAGHKCSESFCRKCKQWHTKDESCLIKKLILRPKPHYRIISYDFECSQDTVVGRTKNDEEICRHFPNFICAYITCSKCIDENIWNIRSDCEICGTMRTFTWAPFEFQDTTIDQKFTTQNPVESFVGFLTTLNPKYKSIAFAHFGGRYDMQFIFAELLKLRKQNYIPLPECIRNGNKLLEISVKKTKTTSEILFHDSFNLMPVKLAQLVKAFGLNIEDKQYFPHGFNKCSNFYNVLPNLPPRETYFPDVMKKEELDQFEKFYTNPQNYNRVFDLKEKLAEYCYNDVNILINALIGLRNEFMRISKRPEKLPMDILHDSITIASAAIKLWAMNYMGDHEVAIVPERGYNVEDNQSATAKKWLNWYSYKNNVELQTAESDAGEYRVRRPDGRDYQVDGFLRRPDHPKGDLALEVHGCRFHGCPRCYPEDSTLLCRDRATGRMKTAAELRAEDQSRLNFIRRYMEVKVIWTCEIDAERECDPEMDRFFRNYRTPGAIRIRDAFFGGRTNFITEYPLGHPKLYKIPPKERVVNWRYSSQNKYKGILQALILPPQTLKVPLIPMKLDPNNKDSRLLFPLCRACAMMYPEGARIKNYRCNHPPLRRAFITTITHLELNAALDHGYRVLELYKVLHYEKWTDKLFKKYVSEFMSMKIHATGFPDWCIDDHTKQQYIDECWTKFQIRIEKDKMIPNPALRFLAKLLLNALWGRFSLRNNLNKSAIVDTQEMMDELLFDNTLNCSPPKLIMGNELDGDDIYMINYKHNEEFIEENKYSNVVISLFTTSAARIQLFNVLNKVANSENCELLYCDTDSVIYSHPICFDPIPAGKGHLGEMTDETPQHEIEEFVCGGCKNYAIKLRRNDGTGYDYQVKVRGFPLSVNAANILSYDLIKESVFNYRTPLDSGPITIHYPKSLRPNICDGTVYTIPQSKQYKVVVTKGIVNNNNLSILPFGYKKL